MYEDASLISLSLNVLLAILVLTTLLGAITFVTVRFIPLKNVITRIIFTAPTVDPDEPPITINTIMIMKTGYVNMRTNTYPNTLLFLFNVILSLITYMSISKKIEWIPIISSWLKLLGKESMIPLCINQFVILVFNKLIDEKVVTMISSNHIIFLRLSILGISLIAITLLTKWLSNSKCKVLFGK